MLHVLLKSPGSAIDCSRGAPLPLPPFLKWTAPPNTRPASLDTQPYPLPSQTLPNGMMNILNGFKAYSTVIIYRLLLRLRRGARLHIKITCTPSSPGPYFPQIKIDIHTFWICLQNSASRVLRGRLEPFLVNYFIGWRSETVVQHSVGLIHMLACLSGNVYCSKLIFRTGHAFESF